MDVGLIPTLGTINLVFLIGCRFRIVIQSHDKIAVGARTILAKKY